LPSREPAIVLTAATASDLERFMKNLFVRDRETSSQSLRASRSKIKTAVIKDRTNCATSTISSNLPRLMSV